MARDVFYTQDKKGSWVFKAMSEKGLAVIGSLVGGPWKLAKKDGVFVHVTPSNFQTFMARLHQNGLQTEPDEEKPDERTERVQRVESEAGRPEPAVPAVDVSAYTDF